MEISEIFICVLIIVFSIITEILYVVRTKMVFQGNKILATLCALISNATDIICVAIVTPALFTHPLRALCLAFGYTIGNYFGIICEKSMMLGSSYVSFIIQNQEASKLKKELATLNFDYTIVEGQGKNINSEIFKIAVRDKQKKKVLDTVLDSVPNAMIIEEEAKFNLKM